MKLLRLRIENEAGFRSLQQGFEINFHALDDTESMEQFRPFCFAGLNGSGKSNVLEALANIFYHLEVCVARYLPESIKDSANFKRSECTPDAFRLEYLIGQLTEKPYTQDIFQKVVITKKQGEEPGIKVYASPYIEDSIVIPNKDTEKETINASGKILEAQDKMYLPNQIVGYSSGENEILSLPFVKSRLIHLDEYYQATRDKYEKYDEPENSLIYIDNNMSQAVLLVCLLFESDDTLAPFRAVDNTGILGLRSFRMNLNLHEFEFGIYKAKDKERIPILTLIDKHQLGSLKKCATCWFEDSNSKTLWLDFYVNEATKAAFRKHFQNSLKCFQLFRLLYELNSHFVDEATKLEIYRSKGVYTDGKLPIGSSKQDVFHFLDFYITKELKKTGEKKDLLLRSFSDGEHQFIHTMGICLLLKDKRALLLLDEPETHFNPSWRAKFIKILNDSITAGNPSPSDVGGSNVHLLKDILLTSHSPFIISDCLPDNVILFEKDKKGNTTALKASELGIDTYGTSVNLLTNRIFKNKETIGKYAISRLNEFKKRFDGSEDTQELIEELNNEFGDSIEKLLLIKEVTEKK
ncbi:restriction system-associated AAA family ATPase [Dyadobacter luticola]|uniref:Restriction system-associated AAA family ATPase n=1 Tax=Dyadobacter luticola TaxID=1979387 RepID=A0A5R9KYI3_9BACT|nr:restriction system-associated AAA family ATPase [Dyadobacter luticola]TLV01343.1 restriction system-associated AAA family ATPase [Dyadobacter luticola]